RSPRSPITRAEIPRPKLISQLPNPNLGFYASPVALYDTGTVCSFLPLLWAAMLVTLGRLLLVLTLLANTRGNFCARQHPQSPPTPVKQRYISLALAYRQQIL